MPRPTSRDAASLNGLDVVMGGSADSALDTQARPDRPQLQLVEPARRRVLVVDDELSMRQLLAYALRHEGYEVLLAENVAGAIAQIGTAHPDVIISDLRMPDGSGVDILREAKARDARTEALLITAFASAETAVEAMRLGACDYLTKPFDVDELKEKVRQAVERRHAGPEEEPERPHPRPTGRTPALIGRSQTILDVCKLIGVVARNDSTVLVTGESGTGKELAARIIHESSARRDRPFVAVNCGALTETLLESELFGHMRGAFTGADVTKKGLFEVADRGTVFLDEITETSPAMQVKLLRVLQERRFRRVGGTDEITTNIRVITASNRDLAREVAEGRFRGDLYYRVNVISVHLPALRDRPEDIPLLVTHFIQRFNAQLDKVVSGASAETMARLCGHSWPGNIRELENAIERAVALEGSREIQVTSLPESVRSAPTTPAVDGQLGAPRLPDGGFDLERHVQDLERQYIAQALDRAGGVKVKAAELLGMSFRSFRYYMKKYRLG